MKEKLDLSLDYRQVASLVVGSIAVLGTVFVLGVVVGKRMADPAPVAEKTDLLTTLDRKTVPLTFQEELTKKGLDPVIADAGPLAAPTQVNPLAKREEAKPAPKAVVAEAAVAPAPPKPTASERAEEAPSETPTRPTSVQEAIARVEQAAVEGAEARAGNFTLQLAASPTRAEADRHVAKLKERGYAPYIVSAEVPGKGTWYRVRMGNFGSREGAQKFLADFKRETHIEAFVASVP